MQSDEVPQPQLKELLTELEALRATLASEKARAQEAALKTAERRAVLYRASQAISASLDAEQVFAALHRVVAQLMPSETFVITLLDEQRHEIVGVYLMDKDTRLPSFSAPLGSGLSGYVMTTGKALRVDEFTTDIEAQTGARVLGPDPHRPSSILTVPLRLKDQTIGTLSAQSYQPHAYTTDDQELLEQLASHTAITLANVKLFAVERRRAQELEALCATAADLSAQLDLPILLNTILERAQELLGLQDERGAIALYDPHQHDLEAVVGLHTRVGERIPLGQGVIGHVAQTQQPLIVSDYAQWAHRLAYYAPGDWHSALGVPLIVGGRFIGVLATVCKDPSRRFSEADLQMLMWFAQSAAIAIENARLFETERRRAAELEALRATAADLSSNLDLPTLLAVILERAQQLLGLKDARGSIALYDAEKQMLEVVAGPAHTIGQRMALGQGMHGYVAATRQPFIVEDYEHWELRAEFYTPGAWYSVMGVPLIAGGRPIGAITASCTDPQRRFTEADTQLLNLFAQPAAIAIDNARLFEAERRRARELEALRQTITDVSANLQLATLLDAILKRAQGLLGSTGGALALYQAETNELEIVAGAPRDIGIRLALGAGVLGHVAAMAQPLIIQDYEHWEQRLPHFTPGEWYAVVGAPLLANNQLVGAITVATVDLTRQFSPSDMQLLTLFAQQAAIAIVNARLFGEVQRLAIMDSLTGQANRRHFFEEAEREFLRARRYARPLSAIMLDIDHFKRVNDTYGHSIGDQVLRVVAQRCRQTLRSIDLLGRYGGEEFSVILPDTPLTEARLVAERLCQQMPLTHIETEQGVITVTVSQGVATLNGDSGNLDMLLDRADQALLTAKRTGRNRVVVWSEDVKET